MMKNAVVVAVVLSLCWPNGSASIVTIRTSNLNFPSTSSTFWEKCACWTRCQNIIKMKKDCAK